MKEKSLMRSSVCVNYMMCIDNKKFLFFLYIYMYDLNKFIKK